MEKWEEFEYKIAEILSKAGIQAFRVPNSGRWRHGGDVITQYFIIDCTLSKNNRYIGISFNKIKSVFQQARKQGRSGALVFKAEGRPEKYVIITLEDFIKFQHFLRAFKAVVDIIQECRKKVE